jgi:hypothetical protein
MCNFILILEQTNLKNNIYDKLYCYLYIQNNNKLIPKLVNGLVKIKNIYMIKGI